MNLASALMSRSLRHVVPVLDYGLDKASDGYYLVMPLCSGTLQNKLDEKGPLSEAEARSIALDILYGLREVSDIVHRDLKPANILNLNGTWCVADFGIAKFVEDSTSIETLRDCLTPSYGAPEQWRSEAPTHATDIYALGCIFHTMLVGHPPFHGAPSLKEAHLNERPPQLSGPDDVLASLIARMLRKEPQARPSRDRCIETLETLRTRQPAPPPKLFARAGRAVVERGVGAEVDRNRRIDTASRRLSLAEEGAAEIGEIRARVRSQIELHSELFGRTTNTRLCVGNGVLEIGEPEILDLYMPLSFPDNTMVLRGAYERSGWDVLAFAPIRIEQRNYDRRGPRGVFFHWDSLLFFARHPQQSEYRWWEAAFYSLADHPDHHVTHGLKPSDPGFDFALAGDLFVIQLAFGPVQIDAEDEPNARARWLAMLAKAAESELRRDPPPIPMTATYLQSLLT